MGIFGPFIARGVVFKAPSADGSTNQPIVTDGSGNCSFTSVEGLATSLPAGSIAFSDGSTLDNSQDLFWDEATNRLGLGTASPNAGLEVANGRLQVTSDTIPAGGAGVELGYASGSNTGTLVAYDRTGAAYKDMIYNASEHLFKVSGNDTLTLGASSLVLERADTTAVVVSDSTGKATSLFAGALVSSFQFDDSGDFIIRSDDAEDILAGSGTGNIHVQCGADGQTIVGLNQVGVETYLDARLSVLSDTASDIGLIVRGATAQTADLVQWQDVSGTVLGVVDENGYVGIGTDSPSNILDVAGEAGSVNIAATRYSDDTGAPAFLLNKARGTQSSPAAVQSGDALFNLSAGGYTSGGSFKNNAATIRAEATEGFTASANGSKFIFQTTPDGSTTRLDRVTIDQDGNVGIGTTTPSAELHVSDLNGPASIVFERTGTFTGTDAVGNFTYSFAGDSLAQFVCRRDGADDAGAVTIETQPAGGGSMLERLRIESDGNIGVNNPSPTRIIDVLTNTDGSETINITNSSTGTGALAAFRMESDSAIGAFLVTGSNYTPSGPLLGDQFILQAQDEASNGLLIRAGASATADIVFAVNATSEAMRIENGGNIGIGGIASPAYPLEIEGSGDLFGINAGTTYDMVFSTTEVSGSFGHTDLIVEPSGAASGTFPASKIIVRSGDSAATNRSCSITFQDNDGTDWGQFVGSSNGVVYFDSMLADGDMSFRTGTGFDVRMYIDGATGNVGIGAPTPGERLEVTGNIQLTADNDKLMFGTGEDADIYHDGTNLIAEMKVASQRMVLQVPANNGANPSTFVNYNPGTGTGTGTGFLMAAGAVTTFVGGVTALRTDAASNSKIALRTLSNGTLTSEATSHLQVQGGNGGTVLVNDALLRIIGEDGTPAVPGTGTAVDLEILNAGSSVISIITGTTDVAGIQFGDGGGAARGYVRYDNNVDELELWAGGAEALVIDSNQDMCVGNTAASAKVHIDQASATGAKPVLLLKQTDVSEEMIELDGTTVGTGNAIEAVGAKTLTTTHFIKVTITGVGTRYIPCGTIA